MADTATTPAGEETLEAKLEGMLDIEKFDPPEQFRAERACSMTPRSMKRPRGTGRGGG